MKMIIYGATEIGCLLATEFFEDHDITIIDKEENRTDEFQKLDISFVQGNASDSDILKLADIGIRDIKVKKDKIVNMADLNDVLKAMGF